jgi:parvulin-like peptidyl-prolyl isomerase
MGGQPAFDTALREAGLSLADYRQTLIAQQRREAMIQRYIQKLRQDRKPPPVTDEEVNAFWEAQSAGLGERPATITFTQVVVPTTPADSAVAAGGARAAAVRVRGRPKEDFAADARRAAEDPGTAARGGELGWFRPGQMNREFERAAYSLRPGEISPPIRTPFGFHVIKLEKVRGPERQVRHILFRPTITDADAERARQLASDLGERIRNGEEVDALARQYGDADEDVRLGPLQRDSLPGPYRDALRTANDGEVVGPIELADPTGTKRFAVVRVTRTEAARAATMDDYREVIQQRIAQEKLVNEALEELRRRTFIEIRPDTLRGG